MSALDDLRNKKVNTQVELCILYWGDPVSASDENIEEAEQAAAELLALRSDLADAKARASAAEKGWHANEAQLGRDGLIFMECMKLLGLDVSGTDPEAIPAAIKRLKGVA